MGLFRYALQRMSLDQERKTEYPGVLEVHPETRGEHAELHLPFIFLVEGWRYELNHLVRIG